MFQLLNKSAIWQLCQCVNHWLWNSSKWPFTGAVLQSTSRYNTRIPRRPPAMVGPAYAGSWSVGRSVGRWYQISHAIQVCRFILGDAHSKQWAAVNASSLWAYLV